MARIASATDCPCETRTSTCRSLATASSGRCFLLAISVLLRFKPIPRGGPLRRGRITWTEGVEGTPQGAVISPLLANIYLHHVYDLWVDQWRKRRADVEAIVIRYADDVRHITWR